MLKQRLALACGGTLGHVAPALVVAEAWARAHPEALPLLCTVRGDPPIAAVSACGHEQLELPAAPFARTALGGRIAAGLQLGRGLFEAYVCLKRKDVGAVLSFGSYAGVAPILAARWLGLASFVHEGNTEAGISNRLGVAAGARPLVAWSETLARWPEACMVGFPSRTAGATARFPSGDRIDVVVTGGSSGAPVLRVVAPALLAATGLGRRLRILHQTGHQAAAATENLKHAYAVLGMDAVVVDLVPDLPAVLAQASFAIACPGAATLAELSAAKLPSLLVSREDVAYGHHQLNARAFGAHGAALLLESTLDLSAAAAAAAATAAVLTDKVRWDLLSRAAGELHRPDAANAIVALVEAAIHA